MNALPVAVAAITASRPVARIIASPSVVEGGGLVVRRPFPSHEADYLDPFLLFDHFGPVSVAPGEAQGIPSHPHRGFEIVSYLLSGEMQHRDSLGNEGTLRAGDLQWMTAGSGVLHSGMPTPEFLRDGGVLEGIQLWVNLPRSHKMTPPRYADVPTTRLPTVTTPDGTVSLQVLSGEAFGAVSTLGNQAPFTYLHAVFTPNATLTLPVKPKENALVYVLSGSGVVGENSTITEGDLAVLPPGTGETVTVHAGNNTAPFAVLFLAGTPLNEPVARYGPFVMNTPTEIKQAMVDYREGRIGPLSPAG